MLTFFMGLLKALAVTTVAYTGKELLNAAEKSEKEDKKLSSQDARVISQTYSRTLLWWGTELFLYHDEFVQEYMCCDRLCTSRCTRHGIGDGAVGIVWSICSTDICMDS